MKSKQIFVLLTALLMGNFCTVYAARAQAPVVDLSSHASSQDLQLSQGLEVDQEEPVTTQTQMAANHQNEPTDQRILRLERQTTNLIEMNYAGKLEKMQQELQQLHGQIEVQNHELMQLKEQVKNFYQDLDHRLNKLQPDEANLQGKKIISSENETQKSGEENNTVTSQAKPRELQTYEAAFNLLNKKEYDKAISGFQDFVKEYPSSIYTVNAHYWLGEIYYLKGKPSQANKEFQIIVTNYPDNPKVADAMLKIALISMDAGNYAKAKQHLTKVQSKFPGSTAAKIATLRLKEIKQK